MASNPSANRTPQGPEPIPPELFLSGYLTEIRDIAERLRGVVREAAALAALGTTGRPAS